VQPERQALPDVPACLTADSHYGLLRLYARYLVFFAL